MKVGDIVFLKKGEMFKQEEIESGFNLPKHIKAYTVRDFVGINGVRLNEITNQKVQTVEQGLIEPYFNKSIFEVLPDIELNLSHLLISTTIRSN